MNWHGCIFTYPLYMGGHNYQQYGYHMLPNVEYDAEWLNQFQIPAIKKEEIFKFHDQKRVIPQQPIEDHEKVTENKLVSSKQVECEKVQQQKQKIIYFQKKLSFDDQKKIKTTVCQCKMSGCIKQYCFCFKNGLGCSNLCGCKNCRNSQKKQRQRKKSPTKKAVACNCEKSQCSKKYCECLAAGSKCGDHCNCKNCLN